MRRHTIGILALLLLGVASGLWLWGAAGDYWQVGPFCWRLGAVLGVWWLAYPDLARWPAWVLAGIPVLLIVLARWPRYVILVIPVLAVLAILRPRWGAKQRKR
jgi:hypothetical protein